MAKCQYCGANPVPHKLEWYYESLDILVGPLRRAILFSAPGVLMQRFFGWAFRGFFGLLSAMKLIKYNYDIKNIRIARAQVLWQEAARRGLAIREVRPFGLPVDTYQVRLNGGWLTFDGLPRPRNYFNAALDWADDKWLLKKALLRKGLPVSPGTSVWNWRQALITFRALKKPVIVKPRVGSRGRHTTTYIFTEEQFKKAYRVAKQLCYWVIVEQHLEGSVWRGTVIDGKCVGILGGDPPKVVGDGRSTVGQLVELANKRKHEEVKDIIINEKMLEFLLRRGLGVNSVVPEGETLYLNEKIGVNYGGSSFEAYDKTHPEILRMFEDAAAVIGDPVLGFDFICEDISKSWRDQKCGIIECNGLPFINLHHDPLYGTPRNVAKYLWDYMEKHPVRA